jgi:multidrug/hemolysin transport system ATP-binding protein
VLKDQYSSDTLIVVPREMDGIDGVIAASGHTMTRRNDTVVIPVRDSMDALDVLKRIEPHVASFEVIKGNMDSVFMAVTGHKIRGEEED